MSEFYSNIKPKMNDFDVQIRIDVVATKVIVGTQINVDDLSKERHFLRFRNAVTIKTNLAYAMVRCANIKSGDLVVDVSIYSKIYIIGTSLKNSLIDLPNAQPFCGSGTILLEALDYYKKQIKCIGMDVSRRSANGAQENASAEGFGEDICQFYCCDARNFRSKLQEDSVDAIVTNLPW
jgi:23S rRNA G2445 N2-methylase RlmL